MLASTHKTIRIISFAAYAKAKNGLLRKVRYTAIKLVVTEVYCLFDLRHSLFPGISAKAVVHYRYIVYYRIIILFRHYSDRKSAVNFAVIIN